LRSDPRETPRASARAFSLNSWSILIFSSIAFLHPEIFNEIGVQGQNGLLKIIALGVTGAKINAYAGVAPLFHPAMIFNPHRSESLKIGALIGNQFSDIPQDLI
jgi:hypothetical protein